MTSKSPIRSCEDMDETALSYAEVKALATGNPHIKEKMTLEMEIAKLKVLRSNHFSQIYRLEDDIAKRYPTKIKCLQEQICAYETDIRCYREHVSANEENFQMKIGDQMYAKRKEAGEALIHACTQLEIGSDEKNVGTYLGFMLKARFNPLRGCYTLFIKNSATREIELGKDALGNLQRVNHMLESMPQKLEQCRKELVHIQGQLEKAEAEVKCPFPNDEEYKKKMERLHELDALLNIGGNEEIEKKENVVIDKADISKDYLENRVSMLRKNANR